VAFYEAAFGGTALRLVGEGDDIVAQLALGDARCWIASASSEMRRFSPKSIGGRTSRTLLIVDDPDALTAQSV
jgi:PhnB protein